MSKGEWFENVANKYGLSVTYNQELHSWFLQAYHLPDRQFYYGIKPRDFCKLCAKFAKARRKLLKKELNLLNLGDVTEFTLIKIT